MIKYKIWNRQEDNTEKDYGIIKGKDKIDLAIQLNEIRKKYNLKTKNIRLENIEYNIDKQENL